MVRRGTSSSLYYEGFSDVETYHFEVWAYHIRARFNVQSRPDPVPVTSTLLKNKSAHVHCE